MDGENRPALVALRDRREAVIQILSDSFARDALDVDAFEERVDLAHRASSMAELELLLKDLEPPAAGSPAPSAATVPTATALTTRDAALEARRPERKRFIGIFGGFERAGAWLVPRHMRAVTIFGGGQLDFREAQFGAGVTELRITAVMGGLEIIVPPTLAVECDGTGIFGGFEARGEGALPDPDRPLLRITGVAVMGGVELTTRLPGESKRAAKRRVRRHQKALQQARAQDEALEAPRRGGALPPGRDE
jgi:hypothetical protein